MKNKQKINAKKLIFLAVVIGLLAITSITTAQVLGFTRIDLVTGTPGNFNSGKYWIVHWTEQGQKYEFLNAKFTKAEIEKLSNQPVKQDFTIKSEGTKNRCELDIIQQANRQTVHTGKVVFRDVPPWFCPNNLDPSARQWVSETCWRGFVCQNGIINDRLWCVKKDQQLGQIGMTAGETIKFQTIFSAEAEGKPKQEATITNDQTGNGRTSNLGNDVAIQWTGFLSSGEQCPVNNGQLAAHSNQFANGWILIDNFDYGLFENYIVNQLPTDLLAMVNGQITQSQLETNINSRAALAVTEKKFGSPIVVLNQQFNQGKIKVDLRNLIVYPTFRMLVDADYLELVILQANPKILSASVPEFKEGNIGTLTTRIKNDGPGPGDVFIRVKDCFGGFSDGSPITLPFSANEEKIVKFDMFCGSTKSDPKFFGGCTVEAKSAPVLGRQQVIDNFNFTSSCTSLKNCIPNQKRCVGNQILQCDANGQKETVIQTCVAPETCQYVNANPVCKDPSGPFCKNNADCDDNNPSTIDTCVITPLGNYCKNEPITAELPWGTIILVMIPALTTLLAFAITRSGVWAALGLVGGVIISIILYIIFQNFLLALVGLGITAVILYFVGGAIGAFALLILVALIGRGNK